jgi:interleukin-1 receptor-associated kinase 4
LALGGLWFQRRRRRRAKAQEVEKDSLLYPLLPEPGAGEEDFCGDTGAPLNAAAEAEVAQVWRTGENESGGKPLVVELRYKVLSHATDNFDERKNIGGGASCAVFRGEMFGLEVAIKRLNDAAAAWEAKQYASEMALLIAVSHENICRLLAFSSDGPHKCLVLELCTGGSLEGRLRQPAPAPLTWEQRVRIAQQVARALAYLHGLKPQMVHRDIKSANVLLDAEGVAKVADFGTAREGAKPGKHGTVNTHANTRVIVGTKGYLPPEYEKAGHVSEKTDSYAFSILLLELLTGKVGLDAAALYHEEPDLFEQMHQFTDEEAGSWPPAVVEGLVAVVQRCICMHARPRAAVRDVIPALDALLPPTAAPRRRSFGSGSASASARASTATTVTTVSNSSIDID